MDLVITILMQCAFSVADFAPALSAGQPVTANCTGSYIDKAKGVPLGTWRMSLQLQREASLPDGLRATRHSYAVDVDAASPVNLKTLPDDTEAFVVKEVREALERRSPAPPGEPIRLPAGI